MSAAKTSILQALTAFALLGLLMVDAVLGLGAILLCQLSFPPICWGGAQLKSVLVSYALWLPLWTVFAAGYLRAMIALGHRVEPQAQLLQLATHGADVEGFWAQVLAIVAVAPLAEEVVFRGYLFTSLRDAMPKLGTHLVVAGLFGLVHGLGHAVPVAVLSLLFGYLRQRHDGLLPAILAHALHNGSMIAVFVLCPDLLDLLYAR